MRKVIDVKKKHKTVNNKIDIVIYFIAKVLTGLLSFAAISIFTYFLKPEIYGEYSLIQGIINVLISIFISWISSSVLRYYDDFKDNQEVIFTNIFIDYVFLTLISIIIFIIISLLSFEINIKKYLLFTILLFVGCSLSDLFASVIRASKETIIYMVVGICQYVISISLFLIFSIIYKMQISAIFISYIVSYFAIVLYYIVHFKLYKNIKISCYSFDIQKKFMKYGLPMVGVWATSWILNYSDRYIISIFTSTQKVGLYDIAYKLSENSINIITTSISMAMMPHIIDEYKKGGNYRANEVIKKYIRILNLLVIPSILGLIGIRYHLYGTIISKDYIDGANIIIYISLSMFFLGLSQFLYKIWQLNEKTINILKLMICSVILNIVLNIIFIPRYGFIVAAITTLISNAMTFICTYYLIRKKYQFKFDNLSFVKILISSLTMYAFIILINPYITNIFMLVIEIFISIFIYFIMLLVLKGLNPEISYAKELLKRKNKLK